MSEQHSATEPEVRTVTYGSAGGQELQMDICLPPGGGSGLRPGVLFVHGGGWGGGNRQQFRWHAVQLARAGFVAASASYRLTGVAPYPAALDDCQRAVRWLRRHAAEFSMDPDRLGAMGSSAGGHLAACLGVRDTRDDSDPALAGLSSRVQCVVDVHGVHDLPLLAGARLGATCEQFLGGTLDQKPDAWADASPVRFADGRAAPMMLVHAPDDPTVPYDQSTRMALALMEAARPVEFMPTPGSGHGFVYSPEDPWTKRVWPAAISWLAQFLMP